MVDTTTKSSKSFVRCNKCSSTLCKYFKRCDLCKEKNYCGSSACENCYHNSIEYQHIIESVNEFLNNIIKEKRYHNYYEELYDNKITFEYRLKFQETYGETDILLKDVLTHYCMYLMYGSGSYYINHDQNLPFEFNEKKNILYLFM